MFSVFWSPPDGGTSKPQGYLKTQAHARERHKHQHASFCCVLLFFAYLWHLEDLASCSLDVVGEFALGLPEQSREVDGRVLLDDVAHAPHMPMVACDDLRCHPHLGVRLEVRRGGDLQLEDPSISTRVLLDRLHLSLARIKKQKWCVSQAAHSESEGPD